GIRDFHVTGVQTCALPIFDIDFPITVVLYAGGDDGIPAQRPRGGVYDEMSRTGGTRVAPDLVHVYDSLGLGWEDITRHEITHVRSEERRGGKGCEPACLPD